MTLKDDLIGGFNRIMDTAGGQIRVRYYTQVVGSVWDDETTLTLNSTLWTSGIIMPLNTRQGSEESVLMEQGKLIDGDKKIFTAGSLTFTSGTLQVEVQLGSPTGEKYTTIELGGTAPEVENTKIYKKQFIRRLTTGSLLL